MREGQENGARIGVRTAENGSDATASCTLHVIERHPRMKRDVARHERRRTERESWPSPAPKCERLGHEFIGGGAEISRVAMGRRTASATCRTSTDLESTHKGSHLVLGEYRGDLSLNGIRGIAVCPSVSCPAALASSVQHTQSSFMTRYAATAMAFLVALAPTARGQQPATRSGVVAVAS